MRTARRRASIRLAAAVVCAAAGAAGGDWPQFMHDAAHTGDAAEEELKLPLGLIARVPLDDAVMTSPAAVAGRAYVVDQMGTAYCVDPAAGKVLWRAAPDGTRAMGSNTSSPCVAGGRVYYGTTAGTFHVLSADDGKVIRTIDVGWGVPGAPVHANGSIYFQSVGSVLHCVDAEGRERWRWDHYHRYDEPLPKRLKNYHPRSYDRPHYGGGEVAATGRRIVASFGWDQVCLEDAGGEPKLIWCNRAALGKDAGIPMAAAICEGYVYTAWPGVDGAGSIVRFRLADGSRDAKTDALSGQWAILGTPAVRGALACWGRTIRGVTAHEFGKGGRWSSFLWSRPQHFTPVVSSPALTRDHCVFTTVHGELIAVALNAKGRDLSDLRPRPFRFQTPGGAMIASSPAVAGGKVYFGSDDGCLYVLGPGGRARPAGEAPEVHRPRSAPRPATGKTYAWPSPYGSGANLNFADDPKLSSPLRLRWAVRSFGLFKQPVSATDSDVVYASLAGMVVRMEQMTGRVRWRRRLAPQSWSRAGVLCADGRVYVPRPGNSLTSREHRNVLLCLDGRTGRTLWQADIGKRGGSRAAPVLLDGVLAFGSITKDGPVVQAWDARTGRPAWQVKMAASAKTSGPSGCGGDGVFYFSTGADKWQWKEPEDVRGRTVAIEARTGKVVWESGTCFASGSGTPSLRKGRLYLSTEGHVVCVSAKDGAELWRKRLGGHVFHSPSFGPDYMTFRGYSGDARRHDLTGEGPPAARRKILLGGPEHACGPVVLTSSGLSLAVTVGGLYVRDVRTGALLWRSMGFAPRTCSNAIAANGRVFVNPQVNGMLYCFEPRAAAPAGAPGKGPEK